MKPVVHIPADFEQREDVRTLARVFRRQELALDAVGCVLRLWLDWARAGCEWRALQQARGETREWEKENLAHLLAECCGWAGETATLIAAFIEAGVFAVVERGELDGLVLSDFATLNPHLLPGYKSIQAMGGSAKAERRRNDETLKLAAQQARVLEQGGLALFSPGEKVSPEEEQKCIAMVMGFDGACGRPMRSSQEYVSDKTLMENALLVLRRHAWDDVVLVQRYVHRQRENPAVVKETGAILRGFSVYLGKSKE